MGEPTIYEKSVRGRRAVSLPDLDVPESKLPESLLREELAPLDAATLRIRSWSRSRNRSRDI